MSSVALADVTACSPSPLTPGVQGAALRGQTSLVLTHSHGLFVWYVSVIVLLGESKQIVQDV